MGTEIEVFLQIEGNRAIGIVKADENGTLRELLHSARQQGLAIPEAPEIVLLEDGDDEILLDRTLAEVGIHHHSHIHVHRCHRVQVAVTFNGLTKNRDFSPASTVGKVKTWATSSDGFNLSKIDASEHALQLSGTTDRPDEDVHIGTLTTAATCAVSFDLVPKKRVEG